MTHDPKPAPPPAPPPPPEASEEARRLVNELDDVSWHHSANAAARAALLSHIAGLESRAYAALARAGELEGALRDVLASQERFEVARLAELPARNEAISNAARALLSRSAGEAGSGGEG